MPLMSVSYLYHNTVLLSRPRETLNPIKGKLWQFAYNYLVKVDLKKLKRSHKILQKNLIKESSRKYVRLNKSNI